MLLPVYIFLLINVLYSAWVLYKLINFSPYNSTLIIITLHGPSKSSLLIFVAESCASVAHVGCESSH